VTASRYAADVDLEGLNTSHALAVLGIEPGSTVLDIGAADGSVARRLVERSCRVVAVEIDPQAARGAEDSCERVIVGDVETLELASALEGHVFDVVLLLDVLEHLRDPLATLKAAAHLARPGGRMIISVPNVTHAAVRLQLLSGRFQYTDAGLLDRTHLHFFDRAALEELLAQAGLTVLDRMRTVAGLTETEIAVDPGAFEGQTVAEALSGEDADTYQFVYFVSPRAGSSSSQGPSLGEALQRRALEAERLRVEAEAYVRTLQKRIRELEPASERTGELEQELRRRMEELALKHEELRSARMDVAVKEEQIAYLQAELAPVHARRERIEGAAAHAARRLSKRLGAYTYRYPALHLRLKRLMNWALTRRP